MVAQLQKTEQQEIDWYTFLSQKTYSIYFARNNSKIGNNSPFLGINSGKVKAETKQTVTFKCVSGELAFHLHNAKHTKTTP